MNCEESEPNISESDIILTDRSTQTSVVEINSTKLPLPRDIAKSENDSVNVLKFCHILQDLKCSNTIPIEKDEVRNLFSAQGTSNISSEDKNTAKRYKYCCEVIKPHLENRRDCFDFDEVILKTLDSVSKSFTGSDFSFDTNTDQINRVSFKKSSKSSIGKVDLNPNLKMDENKLNQECPKDGSDEPSTCHESDGRPAQVPSKENLCGTIPPKPESKCVKKLKCKPKIKKVCSKDSASKCDKESDGNVNYSNEVIITTGDDIFVSRADEEPQFYESDFDEDEDDTLSSNEKVASKSFSDAHNETMAIIKVAMEDFIGKIYKTTQDAVTLIASESAKQLAQSKISEAVNTKVHKRDNDTKHPDPTQKSNFFGKPDTQNQEETPSDPHTVRAEVIESILTKVDSAFTVLGEHISKSFENFPKAAKYKEESSPYDKPKNPADVTHLFTPEPEPTSNSVFSAIKSKIVSIFCDREPKMVENPLSAHSSISTISANEQEDDENFIEKFIE